MSRSLIKQIIKAYNHQESIEALRDKPFQMPLDLTSPMLEYMMERSYLEDMTSREGFVDARQPGGEKETRQLDKNSPHSRPSFPSRELRLDLQVAGRFSVASCMEMQDHLFAPTEAGRNSSLYWSLREFNKRRSRIASQRTHQLYARR